MRSSGRGRQRLWDVCLLSRLLLGAVYRGSFSMSKHGFIWALLVSTSLTGISYAQNAPSQQPAAPADATGGTTPSPSPQAARPGAPAPAISQPSFGTVYATEPAKPGVA